MGKLNARVRVAAHKRGGMCAWAWARARARVRAIARVARCVRAASASRQLSRAPTSFLRSLRLASTVAAYRRGTVAVSAEVGGAEGFSPRPLLVDVCLVDVWLALAAGGWMVKLKFTFNCPTPRAEV